MQTNGSGQVSGQVSEQVTGQGSGRTDERTTAESAENREQPSPKRGRIRRAMHEPSREEVRAELGALSRAPFRRILEDFLAAAPSTQAVAKAATKSPDRWAQSLSIIAKLGGYHEKLEIEGTARIHALSDVEIEQEVERLVQAELARRGEPQAVPGSGSTPGAKG
jgi:hypothetical protein